MKSILLAVLFFSNIAMAHDFKGMYGAGASLGSGIPLAADAFSAVAKKSWALGAHGRYHFTSDWAVELGLDYVDFNSTNITLQKLGAMLVRRTSAHAPLSMIVGLGFDASKFSKEPSGGTQLGIKARVGAEYNFRPNLVGGVHVDYEAFRRYRHDTAHILFPKLAFTYYFGRTKGRHMHHHMHRALDTDNDGVKDMDDRCPDTKEGAKVNSMGCAAEEKAEMRLEVLFASGKALLLPGSQEDIKKAAEFLKKNPKVRARVVGHTDSMGHEGHNVKLSRARAEAVLKALANHGCEMHRLEAIGKGSKEPVADNASKEGRAMNRRVMLELIEAP